MHRVFLFTAFGVNALRGGRDAMHRVSTTFYVSRFDVNRIKILFSNSIK